MRIVLAFLVAAASLAAQTPRFSTGKLHGRNAWTLENDRVRLSTLSGGGFIGEIRFVSPDARKAVNPMRVPHYQTIDPFEYDAARHASIYGQDTQRRLMAGYMGAYLCFPHFGPPSSPEEIALEYNNHGEAILVLWKQDSARVEGGVLKFVYHADLPKTQYRVVREISLRAGESVFHVREQIENMVTYDRPYSWVQHVTFGPPFVEQGKNWLDAPVSKVGLTGGREVAASPWPSAAEGGRTVDLRRFTDRPKSGSYRALLLDTARKTGFFTLYHSDYPVLIGYLFPVAGNPWVGDWQENQRATHLPWSGKVIARGMEWGNSPYAEGLRQSVERATLFGVPTYSWIAGRQKLSFEYTIFLAEIPAGFRGVADVRAEPGQIVIVEQGSGKMISLGNR